MRHGAAACLSRQGGVVWLVGDGPVSHHPPIRKKEWQTPASANIGLITLDYLFSIVGTRIGGNRRTASGHLFRILMTSWASEITGMRGIEHLRSAPFGSLSQLSGSLGIQLQGNLYIAIAAITINLDITIKICLPN